MIVSLVAFGDGTRQVVRNRRRGGRGALRAQAHRVTHTWAEPGRYDVTVHDGPACEEPASSVTTSVVVGP